MMGCVETRLSDMSNGATSTRFKRREYTSTVGRGKAVVLDARPAFSHWADAETDLSLGNSLTQYARWDVPTVIVSDGAYGVLGFEGDTSDHTGMAEWYEPHVATWSERATPQTTLWFWNSEIGWAAVHPVLERHGWRYQNCNIWNKTMAHVAGNVNTKKIRRFPVVSEVCVQYAFEARVDNLTLKQWLYREWKRTGLPMRTANEACGVKDAAVRKYLDQGHLWYFPPPETFERLQQFANAQGRASGRPYFAIDGKTPATADQWAKMRTKFHCPHGFTNIWERLPVNGHERLKAPTGKAVHLNQKPLDLVRMLVEASSDPGDVVWEPFGGLFSCCLAARQVRRKAFGCEIDPTYFQFGVSRFTHHPVPMMETAVTTARGRRREMDPSDSLLF
jgi:site-specific DNA-methyltransferase (adenine-specific)